MESQVAAQRPLRVRPRERLGGTEGNELLTVSSAAILTLLLAAEGITLLQMGGLLSVHMFIGLVLIPPVLLKISSTGYRFARYYLRSPAYRQKGPPLFPLRLLAPVLVLSTVGIFVTGVLLLALGHKSDQLVLFHQAFFAAWAFAFGVHFLAYAPRLLRSVGDWQGTRTRVPGSGVRGALVASALGAGVALAISLTSAIAAWHAG